MPQNTPRGYTYPLYGDAANFPAQIQDFATDVDTDVAALVASATTALNAPSCRVSASANQAIAANTATIVTWAVEEYDNAAMGNLGVNNDRISVTVSGIYLVTADINFASNGNATVGGRLIELVTIGGVTIAQNTIPASQNIAAENNITWMQDFAAPTSLRVRVTQNSGAALNIDARSFSMTRVTS